MGGGVDSEELCFDLLLFVGVEKIRKGFWNGDGVQGDIVAGERSSFHPGFSSRIYVERFMN